MEEIIIPAKILLYQIIAVSVIWLGMLAFFNDLYQTGVYIFYAITSWLLFLIVLFIKQFIRERKEKQDHPNKKS